MSRRKANRNKPKKDRRLVAGVAALLLLVLGVWGLRGLQQSGRLTALFHHVEPPRAEEVPPLDLASTEPRVAKVLEEANARLLANLEEDENWGRMGVLYDAHEMYDPAIACYRVAHRIDPKEFRWAYFLGRVIKFQGNDTPEVIELFESAVRLRPDYAPARVRLGDALTRQNQKERARDAYLQALEIDPQSWMASRGLGQVLLELDDPEGAVVALERSTSLQPEDGAGFASLSRAYLLTGSRERAEAAADQSRTLKQIHTMPDPVLEEVGSSGVASSTCLRRANELIDRGRYREALQNLEIVEEAIPNNPNIKLLFAACYRGVNDTGAAIRSFQSALAIEDSIPGAHAQLGILLSTEGKFRDAEGHYRRAIDLGIPDSAATRALLAASLAQQGRRDEALTQFHWASKAGTLSSSAHNNWGSLLAEENQPKLAIAHFQEATRLDPGSASAHFNWGRALEDSGDLASAMRQFEISARLDPQGPASRRIRQLTANSQK